MIFFVFSDSFWFEVNFVRYAYSNSCLIWEFICLEIFFHSFTYICLCLYLSLSVRCVSYMQQMVRTCFLIQPIILCHLIGDLRPLTLFFTLNISFLKTWSLHIVQSELEVMILQSQTPKCYNYRQECNTRFRHLFFSSRLVSSSSIFSNF
jgi:hypothetical protein